MPKQAKHTSSITKTTNKKRHAYINVIKLYNTINVHNIIIGSSNVDYINMVANICFESRNITLFLFVIYEYFYEQITGTIPFSKKFT